MHVCTDSRGVGWVLPGPHRVEIPFDARSQLIKIPQHHAVLNA